MEKKRSEGSKKILDRMNNVKEKKGKEIGKKEKGKIVKKKV